MDTRPRLAGLALALAACSNTPRAMLALQPGTEVVCTVRPAGPPIISVDAGTPRLFERPLTLTVDAEAPAQDAALDAAVDAAVAARTLPDVDPGRLVLLPVTTRAWAVVRVARCEAADAVVLAHDGGVRTVPASSLRGARLEAGDDVVALWGEAPGAPYHAVVRSAEGRAIGVRYDDGTEESVDIARVVRVTRASAPGAATGVCPPPAGALPAALVEAEAWRAVGAVVECGGATAFVRSAREGERSLPTAGLARLQFAAGDRVMVRWRDGADYAARVDRVEGAALAVTYDDGSEETVRVAQVTAWSPGAARAAQPFRCGG